jgi:hypothetical protein
MVTMTVEITAMKLHAHIAGPVRFYAMAIVVYRGTEDVMDNQTALTRATNSTARVLRMSSDVRTPSSASLPAPDATDRMIATIDPTRITVLWHAPQTSSSVKINSSAYQRARDAIPTQIATTIVMNRIATTTQLVLLRNSSAPT